MLVGITNTPRPYAWGSKTAIAELLGRTPSGEPEAELWLGAHPGSPSVIIDPSQTGGATDLAAWIAADPHTTLGRYAATGRLPFLLKILAAGSPLSLQAHPTPEQAELGYAQENVEGVPLDAANRNYKDAFPKPELIYALSPTFGALCGFRELDAIRRVVLALIDASLVMEEPQPHPLEDLLASLDGPSLNGAGALERTFQWLIENGSGVPTLVSLVSVLAQDGNVTGFDLEMQTVRMLAAEYPGDPGIVISLLINTVQLTAGESLYLPAGNIHAYLSGLGVELMAASDNVLRGGLTPKHIDVPELLTVLDFSPVPVPYLHAETPTANVEVLRPDVPDFLLVRVHGETIDAGYRIEGPAIAICTEGSLRIAGAVSTVDITRGESVYITPEEATLHFGGTGTLFLATTGV
jgi:mannose-6-phosphate isomerase